MGFFDGLKTNMKGRKGYKCHIEGNQYIDKCEFEKADAKHREALRLYDEAYAAGDRESGIMMAYAVLLMRYDRCEEAKKILLECEKMPKLDSKDKKQLREYYSVCQWKLGNLDRAIELMESAASNGKTAMIYTTLGYYYIERGIKTGDFSQAEEFNAEALEYDEEDAGILDNMGQLKYFMGDADTAYGWFSKAYNVKPTQVPTLYYIAKINLERRNYEKALAFINKCLTGNFSALCSVSRAQAAELKQEIEKAQSNNGK